MLSLLSLISLNEYYVTLFANLIQAKSCHILLKQLLSSLENAKIYAVVQIERINKMKFVIQRVTEANVKVEGKVIGEISKGFMVLIGVGQDDTKEIADKMVKKLVGLRIFEDENGKTNLSLADVDGQLLLISQFTLYANCKKGFRPSFIEAGAPEPANEMYEYIISECKKTVPVVERGCFGADMKVSLVNDGPFTIILDSSQL